MLLKAFKQGKAIVSLRGRREYWNRELALCLVLNEFHEAPLIEREFKLSQITFNKDLISALISNL